MSWQQRARSLVEDRRFQHAIIVVIIINAATLGLETSLHMRTEYGGALHVVDRVALSIFVAELLVKLFAYRWRFFRDAWNCFDFLIIGISLLPTSGGLSVLRSLRILRALRLISAIPSMRRVVSALLVSVPGMASIFSLLALVLYVAGVMATKLFGHSAPNYFGDLSTTLFTLFQVTTGEAWPDVARDVMEEQPAAWLFFVVYILTSSFVVLNLFIAVVVSAMEEYEEDIQEEQREREQRKGQGKQEKQQKQRKEQQEREEPRTGSVADEVPGTNGQGGPAEISNDALLAELRALRSEVLALREAQQEVLRDRQEVPPAPEAATAVAGEPSAPDGQSQPG